MNSKTKKMSGFVGTKINKDYRFQIIGLDQGLRSQFLSACKLNNKSGNEVLKAFMKQYVADNE